VNNNQKINEKKIMSKLQNNPSSNKKQLQFLFRVLDLLYEREMAEKQQLYKLTTR
jgi:hypothetical protein